MNAPAPPTGNIIEKEPIALGALVGVIVNVVLTGLELFDVTDFSAEETAWIYGAVNAILFVVTALLTRRVVFSPYTVRAAGAEALLDPHAGSLTQPLEASSAPAPTNPLDAPPPH